MSRKAFLTFVLVAAACFAVACGNDNPPPLEDTKEDAGTDVVNPDTLGDVGHDTNTGDDNPVDVGRDENPVDTKDVNPEDIEVAEDEIVTTDTKEVTDEVTPVDTNEVNDIVVPPFCPCDTTVNEPVCGMDTVTYTSPQCAACALCKDDEANCPGCGGSLDCGGDPDVFIKRMTSCGECPCVPSDECELNAYTECKEVCDIDGKTEYTDVCAFKAHYDCDDNYTDFVGVFGKCPEPTCAMKDGTGDCSNTESTVCGSDNNDYTNKCWLGNCPVGGATGVTVQCAHACPCP
jgi:hypothetical protein